MGIQKNLCLKMLVSAIFVVLAFGIAGLTAVTLLAGSSVVAQNETGANVTGANKTALFSNQTGMVAETKR
jgi:hypothetical protein